MRVLTAVQLDDLADREATKLSGGQQQRLALARALVMEPALLLLDEPLSNLDAKLREKMRFELKRLQRELKITTVYVTHDQSEALALSHEIAVMNQGRILQIGRPRDIYEHPSNQFVADFVGNTNFIDGYVVSGFASPEPQSSQGGLTTPKPQSGVAGLAMPKPQRGEGWCYVVRTEMGDVRVNAVQQLRPDERVALSVRPEDIELTEARPDSDNVWQGRVDQKVFLGEAIDFRVTVGARALLSRQHPTLRTPVGGTIFVHVHPDNCVVFKVG
jgi:iron(III) transport system ATP-binding protein